MIEDLDALLAQPLADVPDNGFSSRTAALLEMQRLRRSRFRTEVYAGLVLLAAMVLPFTPLGAAFAAAAYAHAGIALVGLTTGVVMLMSLPKRRSSMHLTV
jgi:hypothetical protein